MERRSLGNAAEKVSILGIGGYHLLEIRQTAVNHFLGRYLVAGGNYIKTAAYYGDGASEINISHIGANSCLVRSSEVKE